MAPVPGPAPVGPFDPAWPARSSSILGRMFLRYFLDIASDFEKVEASLLDEPGTWVPGLLQAAEDRGERLLADVGFSVESRRIDKQVEVQFGTPYRIPRRPSFR